MADKNPRRNPTTDALFDAILSLETREECYNFFEDLCTVKEISDMAQRLEAAKLLLGGSPKRFCMLSNLLRYFLWSNRILQSELLMILSFTIGEEIISSTSCVTTIASPKYFRTVLYKYFTSSCRIAV